MAATDANAALNELINALDMSKVPDKLHCPGCHNFLANAFKTPCCDQAICETCQSSIQDQCPVCDHSPLIPDLCKPSKAVRTTAKAYLKTAEKRLADERLRAEVAAVPAVTSAASEEHAAPVQNGNIVDSRTLAEPDIAQVQVEHDIGDRPQPPIEIPAQNEVTTTASHDTAAQNDFKSEARELMDEPKGIEGKEHLENQQHNPPSLGEGDKSSNMNGPAISPCANTNDFSNMMNLSTGFNNGMDYNQMLQLMSGNMGAGMANFNPMMGMPNMGMGPMPGMFGNMGSPGMGMAGVNGMNMGMKMNFNPNQGAYGGWNNGQNMWNGPQNNNPNAFSNGMGGDFGLNAGFGYNMSQQGNFHQQQYSNGDMQSGYYGRGSFRGRGRGRGGGGGGGGGFRGRGGFHSNFQGNPSSRHQPPYEQQQAQIQQLQAQLGDRPNEQPATPWTGTAEEQLRAFHHELAPGGQEEVDEALGAESTKPDLDEQSTPEEHVRTEEDGKDEKDEKDDERDEDDLQPIESIAVDDHVEPVQAISTVSPRPEEPAPKVDLPEAYKEDLDEYQSMPPPTAPVGPAAHFPESSRDHTFRGRGPGRFVTRGRGSLQLSNGIHSPSKHAAESFFKPPTEPKGSGIVGAPTGPKAMRAAPITPTGPRGRGGGFQIVGRAAMVNKENRSVSGESESRHTDYRNEEESRAGSPSHLDDRNGRHHATSNYDAESEEERLRQRKRRHRRSTRDDYKDEEMHGDAGHDQSRSSTPDSRRKSSHRHRDKDRYSSSTKHRSSHRSHRHRDEEAEAEAYEDEPSHRRSKASNDLPTETESRSSSHRDHHRSSRSSRHDDKDRDRDRERDREERHRHHRKRSRRDRDRDHEDEATSDPGPSESRHRSRRHKREHQHDPTESQSQSQSQSRNGTVTNITTHREHPSSRRVSSHQQNVTTPSSATAPNNPDPEKDIHTLEREARNRERLLKEQQRRENAEMGRRRESRGEGKSGGGVGRRMSYKYEDEAHERMVGGERERDRWR